MRRIGHMAVFLGIAYLLMVGATLAQESSAKPAEKTPPAAPSIPEESFAGNLDMVWDHLLEVLKENELNVANSDKSTGTITTSTKRYFKILSAKFPPDEKDFRDTYTFKVIAAESAIKVQIQRKFEVYDLKANNWVEGDPAKEKAGIAVESLFETLRHRVGKPKSQ